MLEQRPGFEVEQSPAPASATGTREIATLLSFSVERGERFYCKLFGQLGQFTCAVLSQLNQMQEERGQQVTEREGGFEQADEENESTHREGGSESGEGITGTE